MSDTPLETEIERDVRDAKGRFAKGRNMGRPKGVRNKVSPVLTKMALQALGSQKAQEQFQRLLEEDPAAFFTLMFKFVPKEASVLLDHTLDAEVSIRVIE